MASGNLEWQRSGRRWSVMINRRAWYLCATSHPSALRLMIFFLFRVNRRYFSRARLRLALNSIGNSHPGRRALVNAVVAS
jgi:hypothetical protein